MMIMETLEGNILKVKDETYKSNARIKTSNVRSS
jgi:hypothetical protein